MCKPKLERGGGGSAKTKAAAIWELAIKVPGRNIRSHNTHTSDGSVSHPCDATEFQTGISAHLNTTNSVS